MKQFKTTDVVEFKGKAYSVEKICLADERSPLSYELKSLLDDSATVKVTYKELSAYGKVILSTSLPPDEQRMTPVIDMLPEKEQLNVSKRLDIIQPILRFNREKAKGTLSNSFIEEYPELFP